MNHSDAVNKLLSDRCTADPTVESAPLALLTSVECGCGHTALRLNATRKSPTATL
jgi:hypothetical protein